MEEIPIHDPAPSMRLMFDLLDGFEAYNSKSTEGTHLPTFSSLAGVVVVADKYDLPWVPRLLCDYLWEFALHDNESALLVYRVALHLGRASLARHAVCHFSGYPKPAAFSVDLAAIIGVQGWHILIVGAEKCKPFEWSKLARALEFPKEWVSSRRSFFERVRDIANTPSCFESWTESPARTAYLLSR